VARTWQELFDTGEEAPQPEATAEDGEARRGGFFRRLRDNMSKTRQAFGAELQTTVFQSLDDAAFEKLEETLIYADVGAPTVSLRAGRSCRGGFASCSRTRRALRATRFRSPSTRP
jgi:fused signal recognition particle receptor